MAQNNGAEPPCTFNKNVAEEGVTRRKRRTPHSNSAWLHIAEAVPQRLYVLVVQQSEERSTRSGKVLLSKMLEMLNICSHQ